MFEFGLVLASNLIKNADLLTKNIYESIMLIHPMKQHCQKEFGENDVCTIQVMEIKDMNKTNIYTVFEREDKF